MVRRALIFLLMSDWSLRISPYPANSHSSISSFFTWAEAADRVDDTSLSSSKKSS